MNHNAKEHGTPPPDIISNGKIIDGNVECSKWEFEDNTESANLQL